MQDLQFLHGAHTRRCDSRIDKYFEGYWSLQLMTRGAVELAYDAESCRLEGCWLWPAMPGPRIRFHPAPPQTHWEHRYVAFTGERVQAWATAGLLLQEPQPMPEQHDFPGLFDELYRLLARGNELGRLRALNHFERMLLLLAEARLQPVTTPDWLQHVLQVLERPERAPDYDALAASVGKAPSTLRRHFREAMGQSLHRYTLQRRLAEARRLLVETDATIQQVADQLGYCDVYYFSRQFKELTGVPPGLYRRTRQV